MLTLQRRQEVKSWPAAGMAQPVVCVCKQGDSSRRRWEWCGKHHSHGNKADFQWANKNYSSKKGQKCRTAAWAHGASLSLHLL